jgi:hemolysin D
MTISPTFSGAKRVRSDQEFLPAALSILETPPSPVRVALIWTICLLVAATLGWSYFGHIDIIASAQGKIQPSGRVKTVQPVEGGKIVAIKTENGRHVSAGDILIELDQTEARADEAGFSAALTSFRAERLRREVALAAAAQRNVANSPSIAWPDDTPGQARAREERVLKGDLGQLAIAIKSFDAQIAQKKAEERRLQETIVAEQALIGTLKERVAMRASLFKSGSSAKSSLIDATETLQQQETTLATQKGQLIEAQASAAVLVEERQRAFDTFIADNSQKLNEVERQIDDFEQKVAKARVKTGHMTITSPIAGMVFGLSATTVGQVVSPSEEIMRIVPDGSALEIESYVQNKDIGFVQAGQVAVVKIESFPFTRYGVLEAHVTRVGIDAIPEPDAQSVESNPAKTLKSSYFGGAQRTQNLVFPVTLTPDRHAMKIDGAEIALSPGMAVSVEVKTGRRRILEYVFSPLVETASRALKER